MCGDSHTSTHGALGALAFGIGTTEVGHVLATQCLLQRRPKTFAINVTGALPAGVTAKDLILAIIGQIGIDGGTGHVIEYRGDTIRALDMEERMTVCNMSIEAGARAGMIAPDETTYHLPRRAPARAAGGGLGARARAAGAACRAMPARASTARSRSMPPRSEPMITYGTNPGMVMPIGGVDPAAPRRRRPSSAPSPTWASPPGRRSRTRR